MPVNSKSGIYSLQQLDMETRFYVYHWLREDGTPYYVGKGQTNRAFEKRRKYRPPVDRIKIVKDNLTEQQALDLEVKEISKYGRKDLGTGILRNKTDGGDGVTPSIETRLKLSLALKGKNKGNTPWNKGKTGLQVSEKKGGNRPDLTPEVRRSIALKTIAFHTGRKHTKETKRKIASKATGRARPDMIGNKLSSGDRDNSIFRTPAFRAMSRARANKRWAVVSNCRQSYA